jgi:hypothetical protein
MKTDDFEKQLQRQPLRPVPAEWRDQFLSAATRHCHASHIAHHAPRGSWLRELLWPSPYAWSGLALVWLVALFLNLAASDSRSSRVGDASSARPVRSSPETLLALEQHLRLRAELAGTSDLAEPPKPVVNRPRSARQTETVAV